METKEKKVEDPEKQAMKGNGKSPNAVGIEDVKAPVGDESLPGQETDGLDEEDISDLVVMLNAIQKVEGGTGEIKDIPKELRGVSRFLINKMMGLRDAFADPLFKAILDDMVDQKEEGQMPSVIVAISRVVPLDKIQEVADNENYAEVQESVAADEQSRQDAMAKEDALNANIQQFIGDIDAYCAEMNYDEVEKEALTNYINNFINALADFKLTKEEIKEFDKGRNYGRDIEDLKSQIPSEPKKEVLPDKASIDESAAAKAMPQKPREMSQMERLAIQQASQTDVTKIGDRKRYGK